jgi:hypothetical protein
MTKEMTLKKRRHDGRRRRRHDGEEDDDMMEEEDDEEEDLDESYNHRRAVREAKSTVKPKGVGIGSGPKFTYKDKAKGGFDEKKKEGPKSVGTGKPKFEYKKGENMEQKSKVVKAETKEGQGYKDKEDERLAMKHGKNASKDLKTTKARRDDAGFEKKKPKKLLELMEWVQKKEEDLEKELLTTEIMFMVKTE